MQIGARDRAAMTPAQTELYDAIAKGPRKGVAAAFLAMLLFGVGSRRRSAR